MKNLTSLEQIEKKCERCGESFIIRSPGHKFCSKKCQRKNYYEKTYKKIHINICRICGKEFETARKNKTICSQECKRQDYLNHYNYKHVTELKKSIFNDGKTLNCLFCKKQFVQRNVNHTKFCSSECSRKAHHYDYINNIFNLVNSNLLKLRFEILKRDNFQCQYCGRTAKKDKCKLNVDHIIPRNLGGTNEPSNLITSCEECNLGKSDILLEEKQLKQGKIDNANF